jgi:hypothetical protein
MTILKKEKQIRPYELFGFQDNHRFGGNSRQDFAEAQGAMCGIKKVTYKPVAENHAIYKKVCTLYKQIHDAFGSGTLVNVMKEFLNIKDLCTKS